MIYIIHKCQNIIYYHVTPYVRNKNNNKKLLELFCNLEQKRS